MNTSELIQKLEAIRGEHGDRQLVKLKILSEGAGYELVEPQVVVHYVDPDDESEFVLRIV